ncbi:MAG: LPS export ABC transporter periplasmic protein LptC [Pseudomonadota bacterium]
MQAGVAGLATQRTAPLMHDEAQKFKTAQAYTRRVKFLKIGLPVIGTAAIILFLAITITSQLIATPFGTIAIDLTNGQVVMDNPSLNGFTASDSAYEIVADRALQDLDNPKTVLLEKIGATLTMDDGNIASVEANAGRFDIEGGSLRLSKGVNVQLSSGYAADLQEADIDMKNGVLTSEAPVHITSDIGEISAERLEVRRNGEYILFENRVKMVVQPDRVRR